MALKNKAVILKASIDLEPADKEKIIKFNTDVVTPMVKSKLDKPKGSSRQIIKIVKGTKIKVVVSGDGIMAKVVYSIAGEELISKSFSSLESFQAAIKEVEDDL
jgi:hypothetical protein